VGLSQVLKVLRDHGIVAPKAAAVPSTEAEIWLTSFDQHLECVIGVSPGTRRPYLRYARLLIASRFGLTTPDWQTLSAKDVSDFVRQEAGKLTPSSCRMPLTATKAFLRFLVFRGAIGAGLLGAVPPIRQWKHASLPMPLSDDDLARLLATSAEHPATRYRDRAVLMLLVGLGLRANEVVNLRLDDIDWIEGRLLIHAGKTHRERSLPLSRDIGKAMVEYLKRERPASSERRLFLRAQPPLGPLQTSSAITEIVKSLLKRAGICRPHSGAHVLRHTAATKMLCAGAAFKEIADILGHQSLHSTAIYAKLDVESLAGVAMPWPGGAP
jgi:site-specific recombinase XerD